MYTQVDKKLPRQTFNKYKHTWIGRQGQSFLGKGKRPYIELSLRIKQCQYIVNLWFWWRTQKGCCNSFRGRMLSFHAAAKEGTNCGSGGELRKDAATHSGGECFLFMQQPRKVRVSTLLENSKPCAFIQ
jgi:hypothetical protein